jgi:hypothetical protein
MKLRAKQLYHDMMSDLQHCHNKGLAPAVEIECSYRISEKYWDILRGELRFYDFTSIAEEIYFFKEIKPRFVTETEYYRLLNYAESFCPSDSNPEDQKSFWIRQLNRLDKFKATYHEFYVYYLARQVDRDVHLFTAGDKEDKNYEFDKTTSNYDHLVAQLLARERFAAYAGDKLKMCMEKL